MKSKILNGIQWATLAAAVTVAAVAVPTQNGKMQRTELNLPHTKYIAFGKHFEYPIAFRQQQKQQQQKKSLFLLLRVFLGFLLELHKEFAYLLLIENQNAKKNREKSSQFIRQMLVKWSTWSVSCMNFQSTLRWLIFALKDQFKQSACGFHQPPPTPSFPIQILMFDILARR